VFSGRLPFLADSPLPLMKQIVFDDPPPLVAREGYTISPRLDRLIRDCLSKEPSSRPQTALDLKQRLLAALDGPPFPETALAIAAMTAPRRRAYWVLAGSFVLALAASFLIMWARSGADARPPSAIATPSPVPAPAAVATGSAPAIARLPAAAGTLSARRSLRAAGQTLARTPAPASPHPEVTALQPGPPPAAPALAPMPPAARVSAPSPTTTLPSPPARVVAPAVEAPKPSRPLTPSERDLITDKNILLR